jgi:hypothetical protein
VIDPTAMLEQLPAYIPAAVITICSCFLGFWMFGLVRALRRRGAADVAKPTLTVAGALLAWLAFQGLIAFRGFYLDLPQSPAKLLLLVGPPLAAVAILLLTPRTRILLDAVPLGLLTYMHAIRLPVELVLWELYRHDAIPRVMTFGGRNPDVFIGLTAPVVGYVCVTSPLVPPRVALIWHAIGLLFLANVSTLFFLSVPTPFQVLHGDHANIALLYFPFVWVPSFGVPTTFLAHVVAIRRLWGTPNNGA